MRRALGAAALALLLILPASASASYEVTGRTTLPPAYWQGLAFGPGGAAWFAGLVPVLYANGPGLHQHRAGGALIPSSEPFNHVGDIEYDRLEGGRVLLPLECYDPSQANANYCGIGAVGVADPGTLTWRYAVRLAGVPKAMWLAEGSDGRLWTQVNGDLWAFRADQVVPGAGPLQPVTRLHDVIPGQATGAAVIGHHIFLATQPDGTTEDLWKVSLRTGHRQLEDRLHIDGESEGLAFRDGLGGRIHWLIANGGHPHATYGTTSVLVHLAPRHMTHLGRRRHLSRIALGVMPGQVAAGKRTTLHLSAGAIVVGRSGPVAGAVVRAGRRSVTLDNLGHGRLRVRVRAGRHGHITLRASRPGLRSARVRLPIR